MKAAVISLGSKSSEMTAEAMKKYFAEVDQINLKNIEVNLGKEGGIFYEGQLMKKYDCIYLKGSFRYANLLRSIAALLEGHVAYMPLPSACFTTVHNKLLTHLILEQHNIPMPRTYISSTVEASKLLLNRVAYPIVMKFPEGTQGKGVMFADSPSSASSLLDALGALNQPFIVQEYVETGGADIRALVIGNKVIAAMKRQAKTGEKRSNLHSGGSPVFMTLTMEATKIAIETAKALKAEICGVDMLEGPFGPVVIEANISPGLQGINSVSAIDIPHEIAAYLYQKTKEAVYTKNNVDAAEVMREISLETQSNPQSIITSLSFRGERILLPELITKMAKLSQEKEYCFKASQGKVEIEEL
ncbi:MAG TPA: RimK family alpha-L-glutamate ligase [Candidatus Nanoarchaeia archaeon]|nr:RimK family alpha-L-glutamate ligase [Candidatus Nanoarchaeia archaeon]